MSSLESIDLDTRVAGVTVAALRGTGGSDTASVLVEQDVALVLNELALLEDAVNLTPATRSALELDTSLIENLAKSSGSLPSMVVRDLAGDVVGDVGFRDTVGRVGTDPSHDLAAVTKKLTIERGKGTTRESELGSAVVGKERIGVLEESDEDEPVVHPEVRDKVETEDSRESVSVDGISNSSQPKQDANVRKDDLTIVMRLEHDGAGAEVVATLGVSLLTGRVGGEVHNPTTKQVGSTTHGSADGRITNGIP